ncbi:uncharacterized protein LOC108091038 [Drosophila ficusphila]|uniref:uncharacterized protein LOC108091038 n=1 Tax=Drosophila ficusphila TaxID=30025 RepID=UPI0007E87827|nr:uncharacterized protein LOC108091038 [Drosophila ficusphila]XP_017045479.1 uncharacterized protein LOC108091038 [Drosophila ficusphila]
MSEPVPSTNTKGRSISKELWKDNGFLNYLRDFFKHCGDLSYMQFARKAAGCWEKMSEKEKDPYYNMGSTVEAITAMVSEAAKNSKIRVMGSSPMFKVSGIKLLKCRTRPAKSRPIKRFATPRRKAALRKPKRITCFLPTKSPSKAKKLRERCAAGVAKRRKVDPITDKSYLNFLRNLRRKPLSLKTRKLIQEGTLAWQKLSEKEKNRYRQMAASARNANSS